MSPDATQSARWIRRFCPSFGSFPHKLLIATLKLGSSNAYLNIQSEQMLPSARIDQSRIGHTGTGFALYEGPGQMELRAPGNVACATQARLARDIDFQARIFFRR